MTMVELRGNTFAIKDFIKSVGGKWNGEKKCWMVPQSKQGECIVQMKMRQGPSVFADLTRGKNA